MTGESDCNICNPQTPATESEPGNGVPLGSAGVTMFQNGTAVSGYVANSRIAALLGDRQNILLAVGLLIAADYFALLSHVSALAPVC